MIYQKLSDALTPITAQPFRPGYREYSPCDALKPYIRCFWTSKNQPLVVRQGCRKATAQRLGEDAKPQGSRFFPS